MAGTRAGVREAVAAGLAAMVVPKAYAELAGVVKVRCGSAIEESLAALPEGTLWLVGHRALREVPRIRVVWGWFGQRVQRRVRRRGRWSRDCVAR